MQMFKTATKRTLFGGGLGLAGIAGSLAVATAFAQPAQAASHTGAFDVTITIEAGCTVVTTNSLGFATESVLDKALDITATLSVLCTKGTGYNIGLNEGTNGVDIDNRVMKAGGDDTVSYQLFKDEQRGEPWGSVEGDRLGGTGLGTEETHIIYAQIPRQDSVTPGEYTDTITITVDF